MPPCVLFPYRVIDRSKTRFSKRKDKYGEASSPGDTFSLHHTGTCDRKIDRLPKMPSNYQRNSPSLINKEGTNNSTDIINHPHPMSSMPLEIMVLVIRKITSTKWETFSTRSFFHSDFLIERNFVNCL